MGAIEREQVTLRVRCKDAHGKPGGKRHIAVDGVDFIARLMQHVLPPGFKRIRHYGILAPGVKARQLAVARALLVMPPPNRQAVEDAQAFMRRVAALEIGRCPHCKNARWLLVCERAADRRALLRVPSIPCREPP